MPVCLDCISGSSANLPSKTALGNPIPCEGIKVSGTLPSGQQFNSPATAVNNPDSPIAYDYTFPLLNTKVLYTIVFDGIDWLVLNEFGNVVVTSSSTGSNNNLCPPTDGWTILFGSFQSFSVDQLVAPTPSVNCVTTNGSFNSDASGWTVTNGAWSEEFGGTIKYDTPLLGTALQNNILTVGETYTITVSYYSPAAVRYCTLGQYNRASIVVLAGTNFYKEIIRNTVDEPGLVRTFSIDLTCTENQTLTIEIRDPNQCYSTTNNNRGIFIDDICAVQITNNVNPGGPSPLASVSYVDIAEVPGLINGVDYNTKLLQYQECLAKKGTTFYNKIIGAVKCDHRELSKLKLIIELLSQKNIDRALDCIYDRAKFPTAVYQEIPTEVLISGIEEGSNTIVLEGDYSKFETFKFTVEELEGFVSTIIDAVYDPSEDTTAILLADSFPETLEEATLTLLQDKESNNTYLETFINFANRFCADCIATGLPPVDTAPAPGSLQIEQTPLTSETGIQITTEFNQKITI